MCSREQGGLSEALPSKGAESQVVGGERLAFFFIYCLNQNPKEAIAQCPGQYMHVYTQT